METKRLNRKRVACTEVLQFMITKNMCAVKKDNDGLYDKSDYRAAIRSVQRYYDRQGFERGKKKNQIRVNPTHIAKRNEYLRKINQNRTKASDLRLCEVYIDESYVHQNHRLDKYNFIILIIKIKLVGIVTKGGGFVLYQKFKVID